MNSQKECLVKLLQEETSSLRAQGKRVAAEAVERVLAKFETDPAVESTFVGVLDDALHRVAHFCPPGTFNYQWPTIQPVSLPPDPPLPLASAISNGIGEFRDKLLSVKSYSFRVTSFHMTAHYIGQNKDGSLLLGRDGHGEADILRNTDEGKRTAVADFLAALPAPPQGWKREMLDMETSPLDAKPVLKFKFRDVEGIKEV